MRDFGAYAIAVAIVLSVLCCANLALASQTTPPVPDNTAAIGTAPVGNDLSLIDIGGFLRLLGGFLRIGISASGTTGGAAYVGFLDTYSSLGATWGFSPYKLTNAYAGNWGSVVRQSDGATTTIGFLSDGSVDVPSFNSFCAGTNCYVTTLDDQVNGINATQTTFANMPRVIVDTNGVLAVCPQPTSSMTTPYNSAVNTAKVHLFTVAQLNYTDSRWSQSTTSAFVITGNVTQGSATISALSSEVGISTINRFPNQTGEPGITDLAGYLPVATVLSALPTGTTATVAYTPGDLSATGSQTGDTLTIHNAVLTGAWIVNGPSSSTYYSSAYWGVGIGGDGSTDGWTGPRNGTIGYQSTLQNVIDEGMDGQWAVYDYDTNTTHLDYDGVSIGSITGTAANVTYSTNTGMTLFADTNGGENTSNACFETMVLFPATESSRVAMAQDLMSQDNISFPFATTTSDGFTMTGEYYPSYNSASNSVFGSESFTDAHGMTWYPQSGGYTWPSLAYANNINNGATMYRFIVEQGDSDMNITAAERSEMAETTAYATPGNSFSFFYQFDFEQLPTQNGDWCATGQIHYNNVTSGADAPDIVTISCLGGEIQFVTQKTVSGSTVTTDCGSPITLTPGTTYAVVGTGFWSSNHTSDTLTINAGVNGSSLPLICNVGPAALWDNDTGAYLKAGIYRGYPWNNAGTAILRVMNPQFTATSNAFSSYITSQPALPTHP